MAKPIRETPILTGKDARRFEKEISKNAGQKVPREEYLRGKKAFESIKMPQE